MLNKLFNFGKNGSAFLAGRQKTIISAAIVLMIATVFAKLLGLFKLTLLANIFGLSREIDIFYAADSIPQIFFNILIIGSFNTALIPIITGLITKNNTDRAWKVFNSFLNISSLVFFIVGILGIIFSYDIAKIFVHLSFLYSSSIKTFSSSEILLMSFMVKILFLSIFILGVSFVISALLQVYKRFLVTQIANVVFNLGFIIGILLFVPLFGVLGLCWGVVLGSLFHLLVQFPVAKYLGFNFRKAAIDFHDKYVKEIYTLSIPRFLGVALSQLAYFVESFIAFALVPGSLTAFNWATSLYIFPVAVVGWSFAQAVFPTISEEYVGGTMDAFKKTLSKTINQTLFLVIPIFILFIILRLPIVRLILGPGSNSQFGWNDTVLTAWILLFLSLSIVGQSILSILIRAFYSMKDTKTPVVIEALTFFVNIILALYLVKVFGNFPVVSPTIRNLFNLHYYLHFPTVMTWKAVGGLGLASGIAVTLNVIVLIVILHRRLKGFSFGEFYQPIIKKLISGALMSVIMYGTYKFLDDILNTAKTIDVIFLFLITAYVGVSVYLLVSFILKDTDLDLISKSAYLLRDFVYGNKIKSLSPVEDEIPPASSEV